MTTIDLAAAAKDDPLRVCPKGCLLLKSDKVCPFHRLDLEPLIGRDDIIKDYVIDRVLSKSGGFGVVYHARNKYDPSFNRAIKILKPPTRYSADSVKEFINEANKTQGLVSINIPEVSDVSQDPWPHLKMAFLEGKSLHSILDEKDLDRRLGGGKRSRPLVPVLECLDYLVGIARALKEAHESYNEERPQVIHRDVKPLNVMLRRKGTMRSPDDVCLIDWGIGVKVEKQTSRDQIGGTPPYMAPECFYGEYSPQTDVYAFGVTAFEMLTGTFPVGPPDEEEFVLKGTLDAWRDVHKREGRRKLQQLCRGVHRRLRALVDRCLDPDPKKRFADGTDLTKELEKVRRLIQEGVWWKRLIKVAALLILGIVVIHEAFFTPLPSTGLLSGWYQGLTADDEGVFWNLDTLREATEAEVADSQARLSDKEPYADREIRYAEYKHRIRGFEQLPPAGPRELQMESLLWDVAIWVKGLDEKTPDVLKVPVRVTLDGVFKKWSRRTLSFVWDKVPPKLIDFRIDGKSAMEEPFITLPFRPSPYRIDIVAEDHNDLIRFDGGKIQVELRPVAILLEPPPSQPLQLANPPPENSKNGMLRHRISRELPLREEDRPAKYGPLHLVVKDRSGRETLLPPIVPELWPAYVQYEGPPEFKARGKVGFPFRTLGGAKVPGKDRFRARVVTADAQSPPCVPVGVEPQGDEAFIITVDVDETEQDVYLEVDNQAWGGASWKNAFEDGLRGWPQGQGHFDVDAAPPVECERFGIALEDENGKRLDFQLVNTETCEWLVCTQDEPRKIHVTPPKNLAIFYEGNWKPQAGGGGVLDGLNPGQAAHTIDFTFHTQRTPPGKYQYALEIRKGDYPERPTWDIQFGNSTARMDSRPLGPPPCKCPDAVVEPSDTFDFQLVGGKDLKAAELYFGCPPSVAGCGALSGLEPSRPQDLRNLLERRECLGPVSTAADEGILRIYSKVLDQFGNSEVFESDLVVAAEGDMKLAVTRVGAPKVRNVDRNEDVRLEDSLEFSLWSNTGFNTCNITLGGVNILEYDRRVQEESMCEIKFPLTVEPGDKSEKVEIDAVDIAGRPGKFTFKVSSATPPTPAKSVKYRGAQWMLLDDKGAYATQTEVSWTLLETLILGAAQELKEVAGKCPDCKMFYARGDYPVTGICVKHAGALAKQEQWRLMTRKEADWILAEAEDILGGLLREKTLEEVCDLIHEHELLLRSPLPFKKLVEPFFAAVSERGRIPTPPVFRGMSHFLGNAYELVMDGDEAYLAGWYWGSNVQVIREGKRPGGVWNLNQGGRLGFERAQPLEKDKLMYACIRFVAVWGGEDPEFNRVCEAEARKANKPKLEVGAADKPLNAPNGNGASPPEKESE